LRCLSRRVVHGGYSGRLVEVVVEKCCFEFPVELCFEKCR
jgi:hypothetical protein